MKIVGDKVWAVSCQLQNHFTTMVTNRKSVKYRVLVGRVDDLIKRTGCDKRSGNIDMKSPPDVQNLDPTKDRLVFSGKKK